ncbi:copper fist DNA-binding domain-containing protein [Sporobolomyces koalae]|uniref:copper fist DNA-binding domain-containing protein n=1 Tax=Sporobolomyces koalae TaxID=500713 RepID=UPI00317FC9E9
MVLVDGVKYACQACIKGHRSSKCTHTDRELTEIKKKGRPTSQCTHCRQLRKTRSVHGKCECIGSKEAREQTPGARILPNGLIDILKPPQPATATAELATATPSGVTRLLNPCNCRSGGSCNCCQAVSRAKPKGSPPSPVFVTPDLPDPRPPAGGGCCSSNSASVTTSMQLPKPSSCCSTRSARVDSFPANDILVASLPTPPPYTAAPLNPLFLPQTHGTLSCFCGPTCQCVGCATHDPFALKAKRKRSDSMDEPEQQIGCQCEVTSSPASESNSTVPVGKKKKECCRPPATVPDRTPFEWPDLNWDNHNLDPIKSPDPLPSLRTLLPALVDTCSSAFDPTISLSSSSSTLSVNSLDPPSYPVPNHKEEPRIACSSALVHDIFDGDHECGDKCLCDGECGCRKDVDSVSERNPQLESMEKGTEEMDHIAKLAEMGYFG